MFIGIPTMPQQRAAEAAGPLERLTSDRTVIAAQLKLGIRYGERTHQLLLAANNREDLETAKGVGFQFYRFVRFASEGMGGIVNRSKEGRFVDPALKIAYDMTERARNVYTRVVNSLDLAIASEANRSGAVPMAIEDLEMAIRLARQASELL
jgi:hypothetical protein